MTKEEIIKALSELEENQVKEELNLRGKLISILENEIKNEENNAKKVFLKGELLEQMQKHKKTISKLSEGKNIPIPKKVGLKVQEIAETIKIFLSKKDIIGKLKEAGVSTAVCSGVALTLSVAMSALFGTVSLATLAGMIPTVCYIGLSNLIRAGFTPTAKEKLLETLSNKGEISRLAKEFAEENIIKNERLLYLLKAKTNEKNEDNKISILEDLVKEYKKIINRASNEQIRNLLSCEVTGLLQELRDIYSKRQKSYMSGEDNQTISDFTSISKRILELDTEIFNRENYLVDSLKNAGTKVVLNTSTMFFSRMILSSIFPSLAINSINDMISPFLFTLLSNINNIDEYKKHINVIKSNYTEQVVRFHNPELADEIFGVKGKNNQVAFAA